jgi:hypothetical protein
VISTVVASTALADAIAERLLASGDLPVWNRVRLPTTASASSAVPSLNLTSSRSFSVSTVLSSLYDHSVASHGESDPSGFARSSGS